MIDMGSSAEPQYEGREWGEDRSRIVNFRVKASEYRELRRLAEENGTTVGAVLRALLKAETDRREREAGREAKARKRRARKAP